jgi:serine/threonine-protein kinase
VRQIAESLHVSYVLEGSVQRAGSKLRMWVRLLGIHDGSTVWSATYDRELGDVFGVQDDIARAVAGELGARLSPDGHPPSQRRRSTANVAAYELYLRGKENALLRSAAGRRRGIELLRRATTIDSGFAAAHAALVWLYLNEAGDTPGDYGAWIDKAEGEARTAVALDETLADAYAALGWARVARLDLQGAESSLKRAVAIDPAVHRGYEGLARVYMFMQRPAEQLAAAERGLALDPYSVAANREYALALSTNDRCDEALTLLRPLQELDPPAAVAGVIRGECFARKQMWDESIAELRWASNAGARVALGLEGYVLATSGRTAEARALLAKLLSGEKRSHDAFGIALVYAGLRDYDHAFSSLDAASREGSIRVYVMDPLFDDLHRDPRFKRFAAFTSPVQNR